MHHAVVLAVTLVVVLGMAAQWLAWRLRLPTIVVLAAAGLAVGRSGLGWLLPAEAFGDLLRPFVGFAVAVILFEGGLRLHLSELKAAAVGVRRLCTVGLLLSWVLGTAAAVWVGGLQFPVALILGAILVVTGPTVIVPLLRQARLPRRVASLVKWEGIVNDPLGALLAVVLFELYAGGGGEELALEALGEVGLALVSGAGLGVALGLALGAAFRRGHVPEYLKAPMLLAAVLGGYVLGNLVQEETGLLVTTVMGLVVGNLGLASLGDLSRFKESITILLVSSVFVVLTADMDLSSLAALDVRMIGLLAVVILVVRPASVLLATIGAGMPWSERLLASFFAPRGVVAAAVAGVFGPGLVAQGLSDGALLAPLVFATVFATVVVYGFGLGWLARRLGLTVEAGEGLLVVGASPWSTGLALALHKLEVPVVLCDSSWGRLRTARMAGVRTHWGEALSEEAEETLPLHEMAHVLAATSNDAYNGLVCVEYGPELGRDRVWQLAHVGGEPEEAGAVPAWLRGRTLLDEEATYDRLYRLHFLGWTFQATRLSDDYTLDDWREQAGEEALLVGLLREDGRLLLHGSRFPVSSQPGDRLLAYRPARKTAEAGAAP